MIKFAQIARSNPTKFENSQIVKPEERLRNHQSEETGQIKSPFGHNFNGAFHARLRVRSQLPQSINCGQPFEIPNCISAGKFCQLNHNSHSHTLFICIRMFAGTLLPSNTTIFTARILRVVRFCVCGCKLFLWFPVSLPSDFGVYVCVRGLFLIMLLFFTAITSTIARHVLLAHFPCKR